MNRFLGKENSVDSASDAKTVIIPIPFEFSTSYGKGTSLGPEKIIEASTYLEFYDEELSCETWKSGIFTAPALDVQDEPILCLQRIKEIITSYLNEQTFIVAIGGEHSLTAAVHEAFISKYPDLSVLQLDAHSDLRDSYEGSEYSHACVMRRIFERNKNIVGVGIRSQCIEEKEFISDNTIPILYAHEIQDRDIPLSLIEKLKKDVFITVDADFFDPAIMPAVGTPEPGGFFWYETVAFLKKIFEKKNVVGMDVVEFSPIENLIHPQFLLAKFIYKMIGYKINSQR
jgi:agmatinase